MKNFAEIESLELLNLDATSISDVGLKELKSLKNLKKIHLQNTKVTAGGVADLQSAVPDCEIWWDGAD